MKTNIFLSILMVMMVNSPFAGSVSDTQLGYTATLPDTWIKTAVSATQHRFEDTSGVYQSMVVINRYDFSAETVFEKSQDWTRANFIAYVFSIEADPVCALVYYDSVTAKQNETLWAADAFTQFYSVDTALDDWAEYIRFTASGTFGYELYAIGPAEDMLAHVGLYVAIIEGITLPEAVVTVAPDRLQRLPAAVRVHSGNRPVTFDVLGRLLPAGTAHPARILSVIGADGTIPAHTRISLR